MTKLRTFSISILLLNYLINFQEISCSNNNTLSINYEMINDLITYEKTNNGIIKGIVQIVCNSDLKNTNHLPKNQFLTVLSKPKAAEFVQVFNAKLPKLFVIDLSCNKTLIEKIPLLNENLIKEMFSKPNRWIFYNGPSLENFFQLYKYLPIYLESDVIVSTQKEGIFNLFKIFKYRSDEKFTVEEFATWDSGLIDVKPLESRHKNLKGNSLKVCLVLSDFDTVNHLLDKRFKRVDTYAKLNYPLLESFKSIFNASIDYTFVNNSIEGNNKEMLLKLINQEVDIAGYPLMITEDRLQDIDFSSLSAPGTAKFLFRQPKLSLMTNVYILPFSTSVWMSSWGLVVVLTFVMYILTKWHWHQRRKRNDIDVIDPTDLGDSLSDVIFLSVGAVCQQGTEEVPSHVHGKIVMLLLFISLMFLYTSYSANIVALLQSSSSSIQTVKDLRMSPLEVGIENNSDFLRIIPDVQGEDRQSLYRHKVNKSGKANFFSLEEGVAKFRKELFAFYMETSSGYTVLEETFDEEEKCGLQEMDFLQFKTDRFLPISKGSPFAEIFKIGFNWLFETGIHKREITRLVTKKPQCVTGDSSFESIGLIDCYFAVALLAGGLGTSLMIFATEVFFSRINFSRRLPDIPIKN